ncbi:chaperone protein dnaJ 11, chloroplastic-like [Asparagus officinalis]|uniref:chaperone protein dnaJ 11, chloroplastic-like n=1 Tax=Asparagus officinalis TaxID=4686 RepID=UPI00098E48DA|nr:chaperone protein dnaJ 11, chloroplastic-like [Asparagus officinalis]
MATTSPSLYGVLGLSIGANGNEIKAAYRKLARVCHPDVCKNSPSSADEFIRIHAAYSTLSDPCKRADYDRGLAMLKFLLFASFSLVDDVDNGVNLEMQILFANVNCTLIIFPSEMAVVAYTGIKELLRDQTDDK